MPNIKQTLLATTLVVFGFALLKGCASLAVDAWDRAYEGEREFIAEYRALAKNAKEDY